VIGTPAYMSPEQARGLAVDHRCDLFSLGCVIYQMATGKLPFYRADRFAMLSAITQDDPVPPIEHDSSLPPAISELVLQLLAKDPAQRPQSASEVAETLRAIAEAPRSTSSATPAVRTLVRPSIRLPRSRRRRNLLIALAGVSVLLVGGLVAAILLMRSHSDGPVEESSREETESALAEERRAVTGVSDEEILLGLSAPFSGVSRELGREIKCGYTTYFAHINGQGGVAGRTLRLIPLDDGGEPFHALANMKEFREERKVFGVIGNVGSPCAEKTIPYAIQNDLLFFGALSGGSVLRNDPPDRCVFNYRASYEEETAAIMKYLVEVRGLRPDEIGVFTQQDAYGDSGFRGIVKMVRKYRGDAQKMLRVGHARNSEDVNDAVEQILLNNNIRAVVMVSSYRAAARFIQKVKDQKSDMIFANVSLVGGDALAEELQLLGPKYAEGVIVTQVVPHPLSQSAAVTKYREHLKTYHPEARPNFVSLEGYIDAMILVEGLRKAGDDLNMDTLREALESIRELDLGFGTIINFGPSEHQGSHKVWGTILDSAGKYQMLDLE